MAEVRMTGLEAKCLLTFIPSLYHSENQTEADSFRCGLTWQTALRARNPCYPAGSIPFPMRYFRIFSIGSDAVERRQSISAGPWPLRAWAMASVATR